MAIIFTRDGNDANMMVGIKVLVLVICLHIQQQHGLQYDYGGDEDTKMVMDLTWCTAHETNCPL